MIQTFKQLTRAKDNSILIEQIEMLLETKELFGLTYSEKIILNLMIKEYKFRTDPVELFEEMKIFNPN